MISPLPYDSSLLMQIASEQTGLADFGDTFFLKYLDTLLHSMEQEAQLNEEGREFQLNIVLKNLRVRLLTEDFLKKHPAVLHEELRVDGVICGLPRTGSTMLYRLLASAPEFTTMKTWEGYNPIPFPDEELGKPLERIRLGEETVAKLLEASPDLLVSHELDAHAPEEDFLLREHSFLTTPPVSMIVPSYLEHCQQWDPAQGYEDLVRLLKILQYQNPDRTNKRWILKAPSHMPFVAQVAKSFPDALIIMTHRDPLQTVPSMSSTASRFSKPWTRLPDETKVGKQTFARLKWYTDAFMKQRDQMPQDLFYDVFYLDVLKNPMDTARDIYPKIKSRSGQPMDEVSEAALKAWIANNKQYKFGKHKYTLEQFGLSDEQVKEGFKEYRERYIVNC